MAMAFKWLVNISDAEVQLNDGRVRVPFKGWERVTERIADSEETIDCITRGWLVQYDSEPKNDVIQKIMRKIEDHPTIEISVASTEGSKVFPTKTRPSMTTKSVQLGKPTEQESEA